MATIIAHVGDLHVNSTVGLMPKRVTLDDGQTVIQSKSQRWLWERWLDFWAITATYKQKTQSKVIGVINGDWGDINKHSKFQLIETSNADTVIDMMIDAIQPMLSVCDDVVIVRGTEAHTGGVGWLENRAAKEIGAVYNENDGTHSWYVWEATIDGVNLMSAHHPGTNSTRPWTAGNDANRRAAMDVEYYFSSAWKPALTLWGHYHHYADSGKTHPIRAIYNRSFQLKTSFNYRIGQANNVSEIGGLWVFCKNGNFFVKDKKYELPRPKPWTPS